MPYPAMIRPPRLIPLLAAMAMLAVSGCSLTPASKSDYERIYYDRCFSGSLDRPPYCDR